MISSSCSDKKILDQKIGTPNLTELINSQIEYLDREHIILFLQQTDNGKNNLKNLKDDLRQLIKFDIASTNLNQFQQTIQDCNGVQQRIWSNKNYTLIISNFKTNQIELVKVNINSKDDQAEFLAALRNPLEYLTINDIKYNPSYESRMIGLDEAIKQFKEKNCR